MARDGQDAVTPRANYSGSTHVNLTVDYENDDTCCVMSGFRVCREALGFYLDHVGYFTFLKSHEPVLFEPTI